MNALFVKHAQLFTEQVLNWYAVHKRDLPWRNTTNPYYIYVSEMMLQQTQVSRVLPKYLAFIARFATPQQVADASLSEILTIWSGLGYNRRAKFLHDACTDICRESHGIIPQSYDALISIKGIGPYTANAILAFAFNKPVIVIDANVKKVLYRVFGMVDQVEYEHALRICVPQTHARDFYNALMDIANAYYTKSCDWSTYPFKAFCLTYAKKPLPLKKNVSQKPFTGSNRYYRGQLLKKLVFGPLLKSQVSSSFEQATRQLLQEGLIQETQHEYRLYDSSKTR
jgi:A/G-specific adenine glycosylase